MHIRTFLLYSGLLPLLMVPVWAAGGTYTPWQTLFVPLSIWAWICFLLPGSLGTLGTCRQRMKRLCKDPNFWCAVGFIVFLIIQMMNTGRFRYFNSETNSYGYTPPPVTWLPWSFNRISSKEMINWFVPALSFYILLKHSWKFIHLRIMIWVVCLNGFLNALLAFIHQASGWEYMYNFQKFGKDVYGSFGYPNHGAVYFILMFSLSLALLIYELISEASDRDWPTFYLSLIWAPIFFLAANLSTSRAGILGSWLVLLLTLLSVTWIAWPRLHPVQRVYGGIIMGVLCGAMLAGFLLFTKPIHIRELKKATTELNVYDEIGARFWQIESAGEIWVDYPVYGVGGWGYKYLVGFYLPQEKWYRLNTGKANVHNDWFQFLAEFGLVGFGLLSAIFLPLIYRHVRNFFKKPYEEQSLWANPLRIACMWGLMMLLLDSQFDIPLRSPAVMIHGILLLLLLKPHPDFQSVWSPAVDWKRLQPPLVSMKNRIWGVEPENQSPKTSKRPKKKG